ncbi:hypothetical protein CR513_42665, partial [Mucuna pruriens]
MISNKIPKHGITTSLIKDPEGARVSQHYASRLKVSMILSLSPVMYRRNNMKMINDSKEDMMKTFEMTNLGLMNYFLGIEIYDYKSIATSLVTNEKLQKDDDASKEFDRESTIFHSHMTGYHVCYKSFTYIHVEAKPNSLWSSQKNSKISIRHEGVWYMVQNHNQLKVDRLHRFYRRHEEYIKICLLIRIKNILLGIKEARNQQQKKNMQPRKSNSKDKVITLGPNELPNLVSSYRLDDRNYLQWAQYIRTNLKGCKKLRYIEGNDPPRDDPKFEA